jgi:hypothetical protein
MKGMWELAVVKQYHNIVNDSHAFTLVSLASVAPTIHSMTYACHAIWCLAVSTKPRTLLIKRGAVTHLLESLKRGIAEEESEDPIANKGEKVEEYTDRVAQMRTDARTLQMAAIGALAVLVVDHEARKQYFEADPLGHLLLHLILKPQVRFFSF